MHHFQLFAVFENILLHSNTLQQFFRSVLYFKPVPVENVEYSIYKLAEAILIKLRNIDHPNNYIKIWIMFSPV